ncbi:hypothetical protein AMK68_02675 [candidate division KD3-62 bacterium DG_56]|uniref:Glycoside hydrolase family 42 N-terminal domain-containing protein n=1 Tax=candidate division KD3-62 bacterium DG_56 TaxID=1704032 RepID=A0A0S7XPJ8_9BACT|nr:MAG: hypothetical protein AMK68_02675 [candidate division KD3-62 bacterium DG_56]
MSLRLVAVVAGIGIALAVNAGTVCAERATPEPDKLWRLGMTGCPEPTCDDFIGCSEEERLELIAKSGVTMVGAGANWGNCEKRDPGRGPSQYDWSGMDNNAYAALPGKWIMISVGLWNGWADEVKQVDPQRYWELAERFVEAMARHGLQRWGDRARYYSVPGNEPSLLDEKSLPPGYTWYTWYMEPAVHIYDAVKRADPDNQVVVGALVVGAEGHINALYAAGLRDHFDILDIHAYAPGDYEEGHKLHVGIDQVVESHRVLEAHGDGDKKIFLGEGWSLWPKPDHLYRKGPNDPVTPEMIEHYRQALLNGYRNLTTPRDGFDPDWVAGASYFILNDFWQKMHWKERAKPRYDDKGKLLGWVLDGYWIPYRKGELDPTYRDWGLIDFDCTPKDDGSLVYDFPPYIPKHTFTGKLMLGEAETTVDPGKPHRVVLTLTNDEKSPFIDCRMGLVVRERDEKKSKRAKIRDLGGPIPPVLAPGESVSREYEVTYPDAQRGKRIRLIGEFYYHWKDKPYYTDAWVWASVSP